MPSYQLSGSSFFDRHCQKQSKRCSVICNRQHHRKICRDKNFTGQKDSVTTDSNGQANLYLPNGSYILKIQKDELSIEKKLSVQDRKTSLAVKDFPVKKTSGHSGKTGNITWNLDDDGTLSITGKGNMPNFTEDDDYNEVLPPWNQWDEDIYSVKIGDGITSVGNHSFDGCDNLSEVVLADTITVIGTSAFEDCWDLEEIRLPSSLKNFVPMHLCNVIWKYWKFRKR